MSTYHFDEHIDFGKREVRHLRQCVHEHDLQCHQRQQNCERQCEAVVHVFNRYGKQQQTSPREYKRGEQNVPEDAVRSSGQHNLHEFQRGLTHA